MDKEFQLIPHLSGDTDVAQEELFAVFALLRTHLWQGCLYDHTSRPEGRLGPLRARATPVSQLSNWYQSEFPQIRSPEAERSSQLGGSHQRSGAEEPG